MLLLIFSFLLTVNCLEGTTKNNKFLSKENKNSENYFVTSPNLNLYSEREEETHSLFYYHKWSNFIAWGILADFGIIATRYGQLFKYRYDIHAIIMSLCVLPTITAELIMIFTWDPPIFYGNEHLGKYHAPIGFTYLGLMILQCLSGVVLKLCIESKNKKKFIKIQSYFHLFVGHGMYFLGKVECGFGFYITYTNQVNEGQWNIIGFWIIYSLLFLWRIIFEASYQVGILLKLFQQKGQDVPQQHTLSEQLVTQYIEQNQITLINEEFSNKMLFLFNNNIIDLSNFIHPGGQYIWEKIKGRDVSRFIYGGSGLEDQSVSAYSHSKNAILLLNQHIIGQINNITYPFSYQVNQNYCDQWHLNSIVQITNTINYFGFTNNHLQIESQFKQINSFGKYYQLSVIKNNKISVRQYTCINSLAPENCEYRNNLIKYVENNCNGQLPLQPTKLKELPIIIKKYHSKYGFSQFIHNNTNDLYQIEGPFGSHHDFQNSGKYVLICGGTGILPFLDLLDFILKTIIHLLLIKQKGLQEAQKLNQQELQFHSNIHFTMFLAVANNSELIGQEIYLSILRLQKLLGQEFLKIYLKSKIQISGVENISTRFSKELFSKCLSNLQSYNKFLICGPPLMQSEVPLALQSLDIQQKNIMFI